MSEKFNKKFFDRIKSMQKDALLGIAYRIKEEANKVIGEAKTNEEREFRTKLTLLLSLHKEEIAKILASNGIDEVLISNLIKIGMKAEPTFERDLYTIQKWVSDNSIESFKKVIDLLLQKAYIYEDLKEFTQIINVLSSQGINIEDLTIKALYRLFRLIVIEPIGSGGASPEYTRKRLLDQGLSEEIADVLVNSVLENLDNVSDRTLRYQLDRVTKEIVNIKKTVQELAMVLKELIRRASGGGGRRPPGPDMYK